MVGCRLSMVDLVARFGLVGCSEASRSIFYVDYGVHQCFSVNRLVIDVLSQICS